MNNSDINRVDSPNSNSESDIGPAVNNGNNTNGNSRNNPGNNGKTKKPSSPRRIASSRANGAKSHGPVTPEGKAASSQNARTHGLLARIVTLTPEDEEIYNQIYEQYALRFEPRDQVEHDLLEEAVYYKFQMRHAWIQQTAALGLQIALDKDAVNSEWQCPSDHDRRVLALANSIKDGNTIPLLQRYARSLATQSERAIKLLLELRKQRLPPAGEMPPTASQPQLRNDPNPISEHQDLAAESEPLAPAATAKRTIYAWSSVPVAAVRVHIAPPAPEPAAENAQSAAETPLLRMAA